MGVAVGVGVGGQRAVVRLAVGVGAASVEVWGSGGGGVGQWRWRCGAVEVEGLHPAAHEARGRIAQREARIDEAQIDAELLLRYRGCDGELGLGWMQGGELGLGGTPARSPAQVRACMVQSLPKRSQSLAMAWCAHGVRMACERGTFHSSKLMVPSAPPASPPPASPPAVAGAAPSEYRSNMTVRLPSCRRSTRSTSSR